MKKTSLLYLCFIALSSCNPPQPRLADDGRGDRDYYYRRDRDRDRYYRDDDGYDRDRRYRHDRRYHGFWFTW